MPIKSTNGEFYIKNFTSASLSLFQSHWYNQWITFFRFYLKKSYDYYAPLAQEQFKKIESYKSYILGSAAALALLYGGYKLWPLSAEQKLKNWGETVVAEYKDVYTKKNVSAGAGYEDTKTFYTKDGEIKVTFAYTVGDNFFTKKTKVIKKSDDIQVADYVKESMLKINFDNTFSVINN